MSSPRVDYSASCLVHELTSPQDVQSTSWQSASWRIRELSSYRNTNPNPDPNPTKRLTLLTVLNPTISWRTLSMGTGKLCGAKVQVYSRTQITSCSVQLSYYYGYMRSITIQRTAFDYQITSWNETTLHAVQSKRTSSKWLKLTRAVQKN